MYKILVTTYISSAISTIVISFDSESAAMFAARKINSPTAVKVDFFQHAQILF